MGILIEQAIRTQTGTEREGRVKTQGRHGRLQAKERGLGINQTCPHLDLRHLAPRTERK